MNYKKGGGSLNGKITLKAARVNAGLTQTELAKKIGKSEATIINWEKNPEKITVENFKKLCLCLNIDMSQIFFET